jgi:hypothetical protein
MRLITDVDAVTFATWRRIIEALISTQGDRQQYNKHRLSQTGYIRSPDATDEQRLSLAKAGFNYQRGRRLADHPDMVG